MASQQNELVRRFKDARRANVPIVAISTPDPAATIQLLCRSINGGSARLSWDLGAGLVGLDEESKKLVPTLTGNAKGTPGPDAVLRMALQLPARAMLFFHNAQRFLDNALVAQLTWNLRDLYKFDKRTLVLLGPKIMLPEELRNDVVELDEPLPNDAELRSICWRQLESTEGLDWTPDEELVKNASAALKGCSAFAAEQLFAMACGAESLRMDDLNKSVQKTIEQTRGLFYDVGTETFDQIGGMEFAKTYGRRLFGGPRRPALVVRIEELEKAMGGSGGGDISGVSADILQVILSEMEDNGWSGLLAFGGPGGGKSLFAKSLANTFGVRPLRLDANGCKGSLQGESGKNIRAAMKVIRTIGGSNVFFVASVNKLDSLPPELQRRFRAGVWFFDAPNAADRAAIWAIKRAHFQLPDGETNPDEEGLTGADIHNICEQAYALGCSLKEATNYTVPLKTQSPLAISDCRAQAHNRFLDANRGGVYQNPESGVPQAGAGKRGRKMSAKEE
jgi:hypothetical protein